MQGVTVGLDDDSVACRVCRLVLNTYRRPDGSVEYRHSRPWLDQTHIPEPVPFGSVDAVLSCDFCPTNVPPVWSYIGEEIRDFPDAQGGRNDFSATWAVCRHCDALLQAGKLDALADRVLKLSSRRAAAEPDPAQWAAGKRWMRRLWGAFLPTVHTRERIGAAPAPSPPPPTVLTPQKLPKIREATARYWREQMPAMLHSYNRQVPSPEILVVPGADLGRDGFAYRMGQLSRTQADAFSRRIAVGLDLATLYWVSDEFTDLAVHAAADLPDVTVAEADLPARHGLLVWAHAALTVPDPIGDVVAVSWATVPGGVWMVGYTQAEVTIGRLRPDRVADLQALRAEFGWLLPTAPSGGAQFDQRIPREAGDQALALLAILSATWLLMAQDGIAEQTPVELDRKERKAHARKHPGTPPPAVRLVDLRRRPHPAPPAAPAGQRAARVYTVRWLVRGFWKDQPYGPQRSLRKRIYIAPHLAGPDGKPLKTTTPVVKVLR